MVIQEEENNCSGSLDMSVSLIVCSVKLLELCQILARRTAVDVTKNNGSFHYGLANLSIRAVHLQRVLLEANVQRPD